MDSDGCRQWVVSTRCVRPALRLRKCDNSRSLKPPSPLVNIANASFLSAFTAATDRVSIALASTAVPYCPCAGAAAEIAVATTRSAEIVRLRASQKYSPSYFRPAHVPAYHDAGGKSKPTERGARRVRKVTGVGTRPPLLTRQRYPRHLLPKTPRRPSLLGAPGLKVGGIVVLQAILDWSRRFSVGCADMARAGLVAG
jgi:hypothetical protein